MPSDPDGGGAGPIPGPAPLPVRPNPSPRKQRRSVIVNHPKLKSVPVVAGDGRVLVYVRPYERVELADPDGSTQELLKVLSAGRRTVNEIAGEIRSRGFTVHDAEVAAAVDALAELGVLHEADEWSAVPDHVLARHESNLRYYELFSTPEQGALDFHAAVTRSRVLLLGAGGAGSGILQSLVGAGVSFVRLVDIDSVEPKNLARQFCYSQVDIGRRKVEAAADWVRAYSPETSVEPLVERIGDAGRILDLAMDVDVVVCAIDTPDDVQLLVNDACMDLEVPFVTGGLQQSTLYYWSVEPGVSPCRLCLELHRQDQLQSSESLLAGPPLLSAGRVNRGTGPVVQMLSGLMALETLRYISRHDEPVARARYRWIALAEEMAAGTDAWTFHPACRHCARYESVSWQGFPTELKVAS